MTVSRPEQMLLEAISAAVRAERVSWQEPIPTGDWLSFFKLSVQHSVLPLVYEAVYFCEAAGKEPLVQQCKPKAIQQVMTQTQKTGEFLEFYQAITAAGFHPLVLKGLVCRSMYPQGDYRISTDEDLLIPDAEWESCNRWMRDYGMEPLQGEDLQEHEIGWVKGPLYIELHRSLFPEEHAAFGGLNTEFASAHERAMEYPVEMGRMVRSLCPHDHLLYLLLHAYKHFAHCGFGIRQVCDIGLWTMCYWKEIDWQKLYRQCEQAHALIFTAAVFHMAQECFGMELPLPQMWEELDVDPEPMLHDLLTGGIYGASDLNRLHSAGVTLNRVASERGRSHGSLLSTVFPPLDYMKKQYPDLNAHPARLPLAWGKRLARYLQETRKNEQNSSAEALRVARERTKLLQKYGIIE